MKLYYDKPETLSAAIFGKRRGVHLKPIIFNTEMVKAILDGRKTVTRRVIKPQPLGRIAYIMAGYKHGSWSYPGPDTYKYWGDKWKEPEGLSSEKRNRHWTPPCHTDDILYVRETFAKIGEDVDGFWFENSEKLYNGMFIYKADGIDLSDIGRWHPSIHMPKEAARIFLRVTDVRVEQLEEIFEDPPGPNNQIVREGFRYGCDFIAMWQNTLNPADRELFGVDANPWVWVIEFERCENPGSREVNDNG